MMGHAQWLSPILHNLLYSPHNGKPDAVGDIIAKGAFADSIAQSMPKMLYQHNSGMIAGVWKQASEDNHGLYLKGNFINTPLSQQAREECKEGALNPRHPVHRHREFASGRLYRFGCPVSGS
jgi:hypothetical protein